MENSCCTQIEVYSTELNCLSDTKNIYKEDKSEFVIEILPMVETNRQSILIVWPFCYILTFFFYFGNFYVIFDTDNPQYQYLYNSLSCPFLPALICHTISGDFI